MPHINRRTLLCAGVSIVTSSLVAPSMVTAQTDPLPSWNSGAAKTAITDFVARVTTPGAPDFVPMEERIAVFDNDGTLWTEYPVPFEVAFVFDEVKAMAATRPEWKNKQPFKAVNENDPKALAAQGHKGVIELVLATHTGMTTDAFERRVGSWLATARHPRFKRPTLELIYRPMVEVLQFLRTNGFKTFIVSGGGSAFMRVFAEKAYGIPPEQVVGSLFKVKYEVQDNKPVLTILPEVIFFDDKAGKPVAIQQLIGRRPIMAFGNSDGDYEMLQYTTAGSGPRFGLIVHHTDAEREYAYDRKAAIAGKLDKGLDDAAKYKWILADMKTDWKTVFPDGATT